jgi:hypothetical protein
MDTFSIMQATVSLNLKDPHSKALEPGCLSPWIAISTQCPNWVENFLHDLEKTGDMEMLMERWFKITAWNSQLPQERITATIKSRRGKEQ